jgi:ArsR family transcriptional regulator, arsenate/arsenite/antimonite-responsive transcriptional repressor
MSNQSRPITGPPSGSPSAAALSLTSVEPAGGCCASLDGAPMTMDQATEWAGVFKALGDPVRLRLVSLIAAAGYEACVCDLTPAFDLTGPTISHHLKVLREAGLVDCQRRGTWVYYWIRPEVLRGLSAMLNGVTVPA